MGNRLAIVLGFFLALKLVARLVLIGAFTVGAIDFFAIVDAAAILIAAPWIAMGSPLPKRAGAIRRALAAAGFGVLGLWLMNVALQIPLLDASSPDRIEFVLRVVTVAAPHAVLAGMPLLAVAIWGLASGIAWAWLAVRLPREAPPKQPPARDGTRPAAGAAKPPTPAAKSPPASAAKPPTPAAGRGRPERRAPR